MDNKPNASYGLERFLRAVDAVSPFKRISVIETETSKSRYKDRELDTLIGNKTLPIEMISWLQQIPEDDKLLVSAMVSRIILFISPTVGDPSSIERWLRQGKLPKAPGAGHVGSMNYVFSEIKKYSETSAAIAKLQEKIKNPALKRSKTSDDYEDQVEELRNDLRKTHVKIIQKMTEVQAILGSGGMA